MFLFRECLPYYRDAYAEAGSDIGRGLPGLFHLINDGGLLGTKLSFGSGAVRFQLFKLLLIILNTFLELPIGAFVFEVEELSRELLEFFFSLRKGSCARSSLYATRRRT